MLFISLNKKQLLKFFLFLFFIICLLNPSFAFLLCRAGIYSATDGTTRRDRDPAVRATRGRRRNPHGYEIREFDALKTMFQAGVS